VKDSEDKVTMPREIALMSTTIKNLIEGQFEWSVRSD
jgi:hypothetical protein